MEIKTLGKTKTAGKWIVEIHGNGWNDWYELVCPYCGERIKKAEKVHRFCPNCGKNMESGAAEK